MMTIKEFYEGQSDIYDALMKLSLDDLTAIAWRMDCRGYYEFDDQDELKKSETVRAIISHIGELKQHSARLSEMHEGLRLLGLK